MQSKQWFLKWTICNYAKWCNGWIWWGSGTTWRKNLDDCNDVKYLKGFECWKFRMFDRITLVFPERLAHPFPDQLDSFQPLQLWEVSAQPQLCPLNDKIIHLLYLFKLFLLANLQEKIITVSLYVERPPAFCPLLLEKVNHWNTAIQFQHINGTLLLGFGSSGKSIQVQSDGTQKVIFREVISIPDLRIKKVRMNFLQSG